MACRALQIMLKPFCFYLCLRTDRRYRHPCVTGKNTIELPLPPTVLSVMKCKCESAVLMAHDQAFKNPYNIAPDWLRTYAKNKQFILLGRKCRDVHSVNEKSPAMQHSQRFCHWWPVTFHFITATRTLRRKSGETTPEMVMADDVRTVGTVPYIALLSSVE